MRTMKGFYRRRSVVQLVITLDYLYLTSHGSISLLKAYAAPEVVKGDAYDPMKSDVWSLGVILFIVLNAVMPFDDTNLGKLIRYQKERRYRIQEEIIGKLSQDCKSVIHDLLEPNPNLRVDIIKVNQMKWLQKKWQVGKNVG